MTGVVIALVLGFAGALVLPRLLVKVGERVRRRILRPAERVEECTCGREIPISKAHIVAAVFAGREEAELGGMTAVSASFCRQHCPGGCNHPKEHR